MTVNRNAKRYIDILYCREDGNKLLLSNWPFRLREAFDKLGHFRFTVAVTHEGVSTTVPIVVHWQGKWDKIDA
jgi:hypothetical protein